MNKSRHVTFRCTQEQYAAIKKTAEANNVTVSKILIAALEYAGESYDWSTKFYGGKRGGSMSDSAPKDKP